MNGALNRAALLRVRKNRRNHFTGIQAVTFDVGGTLIEPWPSVGHIYAETALRHGVKGAVPDLLNRQFAAAWKAKTNFDYSRAVWRELVEKTFAGLGGAATGSNLFEKLYERFESPEVWHVFEDVRPALAALRRQNFKLGLISNWDERLRPLLKKLDLIQYLDTVVISVETGFTKPAAEIFQQAADEMGLATQSILHIGDSIAEDFEGARNAGLPSLLLDRKGEGQVEQTIASLEEICSLLELPGSSTESD